MKIHSVSKLQLNKPNNQIFISDTAQNYPVDNVIGTNQSLPSAVNVLAYTKHINFRAWGGYGSEMNNKKINKIRDYDSPDGFIRVYDAKSLKKALSSSKPKDSREPAKYVKVILENDIEFDPDKPGNWDPIDEFKGIIDGNGYKISNLRIKSSSYYGMDTGFIRYLSGESVIKNLVLDNIKVEGKGTRAGSIAGEVYNAEIKNCTVTGEISGKKTVGGICSYLENGTIENCKFIGKVKADKFNAGGICGRASSSGNFGLFEGLIQSTARIVNCDVIGEISCPDTAGGIVGKSDGKIENCTFDGEIKDAVIRFGRITGEQLV